MAYGINSQAWCTTGQSEYSPMQYPSALAQADLFRCRMARMECEGPPVSLSGAFVETANGQGPTAQLLLASLVLLVWLHPLTLAWLRKSE